MQRYNIWHRMSLSCSLVEAGSTTQGNMTMLEPCLNSFPRHLLLANLMDRYWQNKPLV